MAFTFSQAIITGLASRGLTSADTRQLLDVPESRWNAIVAGKAKLTDKQLAVIEARVELTVGQIAAIAYEPDGGPLTEAGAMWARVRNLNKVRAVSTPGSKPSKTGTRRTKRAINKPRLVAV